MSKIADALASVTIETKQQLRGPLGGCSIYPPGDFDDWVAVDALRNVPGRTWRDVQKIVDTAHGIETPIPLEKFRYHWRRRCQCWPVELRLS